MKARITLSEMTREQIRQVAPETVVVVPTASIEQHGPHLPVQTDTLICETICRRVAEAVSAEVPITIAPTICVASSHHHFPYPGVISLPEEIFGQVVREVVGSLAKSGFRRVLILNAHGGNRAAISAAAEELAKLYGITVAAVSYWTLCLEALGAEPGAQSVGRIPGHAGGFETSLVLAIRPDLVDGRPPASGGPSKYLRASGQRLGDGPGYTDDASLASAEIGERFLTVIVREVANHVREFARS